jgi:hypothetical protein
VVYGIGLSGNEELVTRVTEAQRAALLALGGVERSSRL